MNANQPPVIVTIDNIEQISRPFPFGVRKALAFATQLDTGELIVELPTGTKLQFQGKQSGPKAIMTIKNMAFAARMAREGEVGVAESYLRDEWDTPDLTQFLLLFCANIETVQTMLDEKPLVRFMQRLSHWLNRNSKSGSRRNIMAHYDLGNDFYGQWLDETMSYSSGLFSENAKTLQQAQTNKYAELIQKLTINSEDHILEIGCGWGGFAEQAAQATGCKVTGLTISPAQFDFAKKRIFKAGLNEKVEIKLQDYRDEKGIYDKIASIEMFEAVGVDYWPVYFRQLQNRLKPGGKAGLQIITIQDRLWKAYTREIDFIRRYIFPGGMLPTPGILSKLANDHGLSQTGERIFGVDYARTLQEWRFKFRSVWPGLTKIGFDERFRRMWEYYFAYCEAGFLAGNIDVRQIIYEK
jgi:cyclopropane-fatty-acyl-phospholipid synthase